MTSGLFRQNACSHGRFGALRAFLPPDTGSGLARLLSAALASRMRVTFPHQHGSFFTWAIEGLSKIRGPNKE